MKWDFHPTAEQLDLALRMSGAGFTSVQACDLILQVLDGLKKDGNQFSLQQASKIFVANKEKFAPKRHWTDYKYKPKNGPKFRTNY